LNIGGERRRPIPPTVMIGVEQIVAPAKPALER